MMMNAQLPDNIWYSSSLVPSLVTARFAMHNADQVVIRQRVGKG